MLSLCGYHYSAAGIIQLHCHKIVRQGPCYQHGFQQLAGNYVHSKVWDEITYPFPTFIDTAMLELKLIGAGKRSSGASDHSMYVYEDGKIYGNPNGESWTV